MMMLGRRTCKVMDDMMVMVMMLVRVRRCIGTAEDGDMWSSLGMRSWDHR
jgi:hypothetical protein